MSKTVELHAEIVENDAGDIVMRLKDRKGAITFHRASGGVRTKGLQEAEGDPRPGTTEADRRLLHGSTQLPTIRPQGGPQRNSPNTSARSTRHSPGFSSPCSSVLVWRSGIGG
jgi:hypothetical protein